MLFPGSFSRETRHLFSSFGFYDNLYHGKSESMLLKERLIASIKTNKLYLSHYNIYKLHE